jgi:hypothetical protein
MTGIATTTVVSIAGIATTDAALSPSAATTDPSVELGAATKYHRPTTAPHTVNVMGGWKNGASKKRGRQTRAAS